MTGNTPNFFSNAFKTPELQGLQYNTSVAGTVIPIVFGTTQLGSNLIQYQDFKQSSGSSKKGGGGKGGGSSSKKSGANTYTINVGFAICQGPISFFGSIYAGGGGNQVWVDGGVNYIGHVPFNIYTGNDGQPPDATFASSGQNQPAVGYSGTAYFTITPFRQQGTPALPNVDLEIQGFLSGTCGPFFPNDANPSGIIQMMLTDSRWGAGFSSTNLDVAGTFTTYATYCQAYELAMSPALNRQQSVAQWIQEWLELTVAAIWQSGGRLMIRPYTVWTITNNGASWGPDYTSPNWTINDDDLILPGGDTFSETIEENPTDPVIAVRSDPAMVPNFLALDYRNGQNAYNTDVVPDFDQGSLQLPAGTPAITPTTNVRSQPNKTGQCFTNPECAFASVQLMLQDQIYVRTKSIKFTLGWKHQLVDLMDIIAINDSVLGWVNKWCWVVGIDEGDDGRLEIECKEIATQNGILSGAKRQTSTGAPLPVFATPPNVNLPAFVVPTSTLLAAYGYATPELLIGLSGNPPANFGGAQVYVSTDGNNYGYVGTETGASVMGVTTATLAAYDLANPNLTNTLSVSLAESGGTLLSVSTQAAQQGNSLCALLLPDGTVEFLSFTTATLTGPNRYDLTGLYRGLYGTSGVGFPVGSQFVYLGSNQFFSYTIPNQFVGQPLFFKFLSFNAFGLELQDLADVVVYEFIPQGSMGTRAVLRAVAVPLEVVGTTSVVRMVTVPLEVLGGASRAVTAPTEIG